MLDIDFGNLKDTKDGINCDRRKSDLGNPFAMETEDQRNKVVGAFREYLASVLLHFEDPLVSAQSISKLTGLTISDIWKSRRITMIGLKKEMDKLYKLAKTSKIILSCSFSPGRCHCQIIADYLNWIDRVNNSASRQITPIKIIDTRGNAWATYPKLNKNDNLADYKSQEQPAPVKIDIIQSIKLSELDFDNFVQNLLTPQVWLEGKGGNLMALEIYAFNRQAIYVNPQGHSYARYVGFPLKPGTPEPSETSESLGF